MSRHDASAPPRKRPRADGWIYLVAFFLAVQVGLYLYPHLRPGPVGWLCWTIGSDFLLWLVIAAGLLVMAIAWALWRPPLLNRWRLVGLGCLLLLASASFMYRVYPSSRDNRPSRVRFRLPLDGPILVGWGGATPDVNYHVHAPAQRWAYDLLVAKHGVTYRGAGVRLADFYCYGMPVLAPAAGKVVAVLDGIPDQPAGVLGGEPPGGNQIVLEVAPREYLFLCHLQRGTLLVREGDTVAAGQTVAQVGNSGNTSEPHLHVHLQSTPYLEAGEGIPLYFHEYRVDGRVVERGIPRGGYSRGGPRGQTVEHAGG